MTQARPDRLLPAPLRPWIGPFVNRPRLLAAIGVGVGVWILCLFAPWPLSWSTAAIFAWDAACLTFILAVLGMMRGRAPEAIKAMAATQDEGQGLILTVVIVAAAASVWAIGSELSLAKHDDGLIRAARIGLAFATVAASWLIVQTIFALHYAHEYYAPDEGPSDDVAGGLMFPGGEEPDYWDFLHFSVVIGVACQTADIEFTSKGLRRIGTIHGVVAFVFNTVVLALTINLLAGLF
ncbi:MAG: DUF1345 domain-containing protein [Pseudomonadota bacterium]